MPPRGYRDESKRLAREIDATERQLVRLCSELGHDEQSEHYKRQLADRGEGEARRKAANGREADLQHLVDISVSQERQGITAWAAAGKIANQIGGNAQARHASRKRLYGKFQKASALYRRLASAPENPADAADREIWEQLEKSFPTGGKCTPPWRAPPRK